METLSLDFNRVDRQGRVRIGPEARRRIWATFGTHAPVVGDRVLVVDGEGSACEGILEPASLMDPSTEDWLFDFAVRLDMATWQDGTSEHADRLRQCRKPSP